MVSGDYRNSHGVRIPQCCASCKHHDQYSSNQRMCKMNSMLVYPGDSCAKWVPSKGMLNAGKVTDGKVKKLRYMVDYYYSQPSKYERVPFIANWEMKNGTRFLNF